MLIAVRGRMTTSLFFEVGAVGRLQRVHVEISNVSSCTFQRIRIVSIRDHQWIIDPHPDSISGDQEWRLWAWGSRTLVRLQWDPREWQWRDPFAGADCPPTPFFQYSARLGRHILMARRQGVPAAAKHWRRQGISSARNLGTSSAHGGC